MTDSSQLSALRRTVYRRFLREVESAGPRRLDSEDTRRQVRRLVRSLSASEALDEGRMELVENQVLWEISGLGPLQPLFADATLSDVLINGPHDVWVDRNGLLERSDVVFDDDEHVLRILRRMVSSHGRHVDESSPYVDVRLSDGSRLNAVIPPLVVAPTVSIRRRREMPFRLDDLLENGTVDGEIAETLQLAVAHGLNVLISGGAASGKTTLLNTLGAFIPRHERVVTIEETVELVFDHPHVVSLEARPANIEGRGEVTLRDLVRNSLRMRPDRVIVGEVRGGEVFDMLQAMNTGHDGSLATVHANSPADALRRLESLVLMGGFDLPSHSIRELLGAAFDLIVQLSRFADGRRRVTSIGEVQLDEAGNTSVRECYSFERKRGPGIEPSEGRHRRLHRPAFLDQLVERGEALDVSAWEHAESHQKEDESLAARESGAVEVRRPRPVRPTDDSSGEPT